MATELAHESLAAVNADPQSRPAGVFVGKARDLLLQRQGGARGADRVVGPVSSRVETRHHAIADELLYVPAKSPRDEGRSDLVVGIEHVRDLCRSGPLREGREACEVAEYDTDLTATLASSREIQLAEALIMPLAMGSKADE